MQGFTPNTDFSELHSTMRAIELASNSIQVSSYSSLFLIIAMLNIIMLCICYFQMQINPAASEAIILSLGQSSQPYKTCQFILG